ncbi:hypothetical protein [Rhizobium sullae]|uniref:hypothetical protein n=1 Tax=Rhizobium sullae TaxID=50338 RepID=UPI00140433B7|nr:hypothetical protein [Rhizobium sullae]
MSAIDLFIAHHGLVTDVAGGTNAESLLFLVMGSQTVVSRKLSCFRMATVVKSRTAT